MEYKIISGPVTEIRRGWMPTKRGGQRVRRGTKAKKSSIEKIKRNETDAIKKLTRVLNCNFRMGDLNKGRTSSSFTPKAGKMRTETMPGHIFISSCRRRTMSSSALSGHRRR